MHIGWWARSFGYGLLALLTLESAARIDDYFRDGAPLLKPYTINTLFRPSPHGREGVPGARFGKWQMNSLGYRGPEPAPGSDKVLTFGASETFGLYESAGKEYPRVLEERLNAAAPAVPFNVVNSALPGLRIGRMGYLEHALESTRASHVVVYPSPANYIGTTQPFCRQQSRPVQSETSVADRVRLAGKVDQLVKTHIPRAALSPARRLAIWRATRHEPPIPRVPEATLSAFREDLRCVVRVARERNAVPVLVTHATYFGDTLKPEDDAMMLTWRRFYPTLLPEGFLDLEKRANEVVRSVAAEAGVPLVDAAASIPGGAANFADFVHFTDQGAGLMAELIAERIAGKLPQANAKRLSPP